MTTKLILAIPFLHYMSNFSYSLTSVTPKYRIFSRYQPLELAFLCSSFTLVLPNLVYCCISYRILSAVDFLSLRAFSSQGLVVGSLLVKNFYMSRACMLSRAFMLSKALLLPRNLCLAVIFCSHRSKSKANLESCSHPNLVFIEKAT